MKCNGVRDCEPIYLSLLTLPVGTKLENCIETAMFYDRVLGAGIYSVFSFSKTGPLPTSKMPS